GKTLASVAQANELKVGNVAGNAPPRSAEFSGPSVLFSPDGATLAAGAFGGEVRLFDPATLKEKTVLPTVSQEVRALAFSPDSRRLVAALNGRRVYHWEDLRVAKGKWGSISDHEKEQGP